MLRIICCTLVTLFFVLGLMTGAYLLMLAFLRRKAKNEPTFCVIPLSGNRKSDIRRVMYAYERINLFGEDSNCKIIVCFTDENFEEAREIKNIFALCPCVRVVEREDIDSYLAVCQRFESH